MLSPNLVIGGVPGLSERGWEEGSLHVGEVAIGIEDLRTCCIVATFDPDTKQQDVNVLRRVQKKSVGWLELNC